ncbi:uncharacterized protein LOC117122061 isoform X2 [Anneissia japonica]|uniref:uncharacterized protein LOC117122061 isoform X2 n=1 Tax=Anneissia japonica TaxID=1529436 RepID=UPI00142563BC|nr:uncharacterized protein LOC117122061 isoform X2 [Anneissia japonica]
MNTRKNKVDYRALCNGPERNVSKQRNDKQERWSTTKLFDLDLIEQKDDLCLVHYIGWDKKYDEWKAIEYVVDLKSVNENAEDLLIHSIKVNIKQTLIASCVQNPMKICFQVWTNI